MTRDDINKRVQMIADSKGDYEVAHGLEDGLRDDFIAYIASLDLLPALAEKAKIVLSTNAMEFPRYCA